MKKADWKFNNLPLWVQKGGMIKKMFPQVFKSKDKYIFSEIKSKADTLLKYIDMMYEEELKFTENKLQRAINKKDAFLTKMYSQKQELLKKEYVFVKRLYSKNNDIAMAGFDFTKELDDFADNIAKALKEGKSLKTLPTYNNIQRLDEYIRATHCVVYYLLQFEKKYRLETQKIADEENTNERYIASLKDRQEFLYYSTLKVVKHMWGSISSALNRAIAGKPIIKVKSIKESPISTELSSDEFYDTVLNKIVAIREQVRGRENELYAKETKER